ncbi:MAG: dihydrolipoamide acetyltransferase family protein [Planctomycetota bacterium]|nr:dihydrolipoamide acetyltransferase family protein [Planctomycetota bacterium]
MPSEITMPQLSDTMTEGTVVKWHKNEGDKVNAGDELADVETDKATMPIEAFDSGTLAHIAAKEGQKVAVGDSLGVIALPGEDPAQVKRNAQSNSHGQTLAAPDQAPAAAALELQRPPSPAAAVPKDADLADRTPVSFLARRIATDKAVDLAQVQGSGPNGRIVERDILAFLEQPQPKPAAPRTPSAPSQKTATQPLPTLLTTGQKKTIPLTKMRSAIALALQRSKQTIPHYYESIDIDLENLAALRDKLNHQLEKENIRLSIADFIAKATATALLQHPALNARFNSEKSEITQYGDVNLGIAVAIPDGLIVPVLRGVNQMGLRDIRLRSADLIERARDQRLRREEQTDSTFTITSLGTHGIREFSAIINPPEVAILAVGAAQKRPAVINNQILPRTLLTATLSADHRVVDGAVAAQFLTTLKSLLETPGLMLL